MQIHSLQQAGAAQSVSRTNAAKPTTPVQSAPGLNPATSDQLELSAEAQQLSESRQTGAAPPGGEIRTERVAALRQAIASGSYETPEKMSAALDKMLDTFA